MHKKLRRTQLEQSVEQHLVKQMKGWGFCLKMPANLWRGAPDRLIIIAQSSKRRGRVVFAETKRPVGGKLSTAQRMWRKLLTEGGAEWRLLSTIEEVDEFLTEGDYE